MRLEVGEQREEDGEGEFKDLRHRGDAVLGQGHAQVLLDGVDEHLVGLEDGPGVLQDGQEQLEGQDLRTQLVGPEVHGEGGRSSSTASMDIKPALSEKLDVTALASRKTTN